MLDRGFLAAALLATALGGLSHAIVGTLSPRLIADLGEPDLYPLVAGGYLVATFAGALGAVPLARRFPGPLLLWVGLVMLTGGLFVSLASTAMWQLVLARTLSGAGAGIAFVSALANLGRASGSAAALAAAFGAGFALGPAIGGALTDLVGWRWVFAVSLAVAIVAIVLVRRSGWAAAGEDQAHGRAGRADLASLAALAASSGAIFVALLFIPLAAGSGPGGGWAGTAVVAVPLALGITVGAIVAARAIDHRAAGPGLVLLLVALVAHAAVGADRALGALVAVVAGVGIGLALAGLTRAGHSAVLHVALRQVSGLAGLAAAAVVMLTLLREQLVTNLRPIVEAVLADVPDELQAFARAAAEQALRTLGDSLTAANLADAQRGFASVVIGRLPADFQPLAEPYRDALNAAFADALRTGLAGTFLLGAGLAAVALMAFVAARLAAGRRSDAPGKRWTG